jgi:hypothetical protein
MPRLLRAAVAALLLLVLAVPAVGAEQAPPCTDAETGELVLTEQEAWLHPAETKAGNLGAIGATDFPSWDGEAPTESVQQGAGGGYAANSANFAANEPDAETLIGFTAEGLSSGCLDTLLIDLYAFLPTNRTGTSGELKEADFTGIVTLEADGKTLMFPQEVDFATVANPGGNATYRLRVSVSNLHDRLLRAKLDPEGDRTLRLNIQPRYLNTDNVVFVYDTTEVPAGLTFNGVADDSYRDIRA